jgi:hypothetical protein
LAFSPGNGKAKGSPPKLSSQRTGSPAGKRQGTLQKQKSFGANESSRRLKNDDDEWNIGSPGIRKQSTALGLNNSFKSQATSSLKKGSTLTKSGTLQKQGTAGRAQSPQRKPTGRR